MKYEDLVENFNAVCAKCNLAIERANQALVDKAVAEVEVRGLREELKLAYQQISDLKYQLQQKEK